MIFRNASSLIRKEEIRAQVTIGNYVKRTPEVASFSVSKSRGSPSASFSCTLRVKGSEISTLQDNMGDVGAALDLSSITFNDVGAVLLRIEVDGSIIPLFKGFIRQISIRNDFFAPDSYLVDISGNDAMFLLENRTYTRRVKADGMSVFAVITGVARKATTTRNRSHSSELGRAGGRGLSPVNTVGFLSNLKINAGTLDVRFGSEFGPGFRGLDSAQTSSAGTVGEDNLIIEPVSVVLGPGNGTTFTCTNCPEEDGDDDRYTWSIVSSEVGFIVFNDAQSDSVTTDEVVVEYLHNSNLNNTIRVVDNDTNRSGSASILGFPIHDHTSIGRGGPAFGVYSSITP